MPHVGEHFNSTRANSAQIRQSTNEVLMVAPTAFGFNDQVGSVASVCFVSGAKIFSTAHQQIYALVGLLCA